ncbi:unnamed protein product, partial [marine sediment metagenome]
SAHRPSFSIETIPENIYLRSQINLRVTITKNNDIPYIEEENLTGYCVVNCVVELVISK